MHTVVSGLVGLIFGLGLILSGMANPAKVLGFLTWQALGIPLWPW